MAAVPAMTMAEDWRRWRTVVRMARAAVAGMVAVVDGHRGIARRRIVRGRRIVDGRCVGRRCFIAGFGGKQITYVAGRHAARQQAQEANQEKAMWDVHVQPLFLVSGEVILPSCSDKCQELSQNECPPLPSGYEFGILPPVFTPRSGGEIGRHACLRCMWSDPCGFESRPEHHVVGYSSGQRGQTVNLLACAFGGSNPPPTTNSPVPANARTQAQGFMV